MEESLPLRADSLIVKLKVNPAHHIKPPNKPKDTDITQIKEAGSVLLPNSLDDSDLYLSGLSSEGPAATLRLVKALENSTTSVSGGKETSKDNQRDEELLNDQVTVQPGSNSLLLAASHFPYLASVSYTAPPLGTTYWNDSTTATFSTVHDSAYASTESQESGYYSQPVEFLEDSIDTIFTGPTPATLGWVPDTDLMKLYTFFAPKAHRAYFELRQEYEETSETPLRVYLDFPQ